MTAEIKTMPGVQRDLPARMQPDPVMIDRLERALAHARAGTLRAFAIAMVMSDGTTADGWTVAESADDQDHLLVASVCYLQHRLAAHKNAHADKLGDPAVP